MRNRGMIRRMEILTEVQGSVQAFGGGVVARLDGRKPAPALAGESGFSYGALFEHLQVDLGTLRQGLVGADDTHDRNLIRYAKAKKESEGFTTRVYRRQSRLRQVLEGVYGDDQGYELGVIQGPTPRYGTGLLEQVDQTVKLLGKPVGKLPVVDFDGIEVNLEVVASGLEIEKQQLLKAYNRQVRLRKEVGETRVRKSEAIAEYDRSFPWIAQTFESLFRLAGEHELAKRIRTSRRAASEVAGTETASEEPSSGDSVTEEPAPPSTGSTEADSASAES